MYFQSLTLFLEIRQIAFHIFSSAQEGKVEVFTLCYTMVEMYLSYKRMFIVSGCLLKNFFWVSKLKKILYNI